MADAGSSEATSRQLDELQALEAIFGAEHVAVEEASTSRSVAVRLQRGTDEQPELHATLHAALPPAYPAWPPTLSLSCPWASAAAIDRVLAELRATATESGALDQECLVDLVQAATALLAEEAEAAAASAAAAASQGAPAAAEALQEAVVRIDHMNAPGAYQKALGKWAAALGIGARCLHAASGGGAARVGGVLVVLHGSPDAVSGWLLRLRSEYVDVDRSGRPCKERQSTVLCRRELRSAPLAGWAVEAYEGEAGLDRALEALGVLHVGVGLARFAESGAPAAGQQRHAGTASESL